MSPVAVGVEPGKTIVDAPPAQPAKVGSTHHPLDALTPEEVRSRCEQRVADHIKLNERLDFSYHTCGAPAYSNSGGYQGYQVRNMQRDCAPEEGRPSVSGDPSCTWPETQDTTS